MEWILVGEFELKDGSQAKIWFREGERGESGYQWPHDARITVASFDPANGKPRLATDTLKVTQFVYP